MNYTIKKHLKGKMYVVSRVRATLRNIYTGEKRIIPWNDNIIPDAYLDALSRRSINEALLANEAIITYGAVGGGPATPVASDTKMESEIARKLLATTTRSGAVSTFETYFNSSEANGTLITKFALFGEDASAAADSGTLCQYAVLAISFTKASNEDLQVDSQITFSRG